MSEDATQCTVTEKSIFCPEVVNARMSKMIEQFQLPNWTTVDSHGLARKCPSCSQDLTQDCVRSLTLCLNAQHIGDIQVEFMCRKCYANFFLHFRKACINVVDFAEYLNSSFAPQNGEPVLQDKIPLSENNIAEVLVKEDITKRGESVCLS
jgi:hypothetical protein